VGAGALAAGGLDYEDEKGRLDRKKQAEVLYARYESHDEVPGHNVDNETWEKNQIDKAIVHFGAADARTAKDEYDLVFDESMQIDFVMEHTIAGDAQNKQLAEAPVITEAERKSTLRSVLAWCRLHKFAHPAAATVGGGRARRARHSAGAAVAADVCLPRRALGRHQQVPGT